MFVLVAGMPRSGSTFSFNVARETLGRSGTVHHEPGTDLVGAIRRSGGSDHVLVKSHRLNRRSLHHATSGRVTTIATVRRVEDAMASWLDTFETVSEAMSVRIMRDWLRLFRRLRSHATVVAYETIDRDPEYATWLIARTVRPSIGAAEVAGIAARLDKAEIKRRYDQLSPEQDRVKSLGFSHFDSATLFHRRHISTLQSRAAEERMSMDRLDRIRRALAADVERSGLETVRRWVGGA